MVAGSKNLQDLVLNKEYIETIDTAFIPYLKTGIFGSYLECEASKTLESY